MSAAVHSPAHRHQLHPSALARWTGFTAPTALPQCDVTFDLDHWSVCLVPARAVARNKLRDSVVSTLSPIAGSEPWLRRHRHLALPQLLLELFPLLAAAHAADMDPVLYEQRHITLCMLGAFTATRATAAIRIAGLAQAGKDARVAEAIDNIRLLFVESIRQVYSTLKIQQQR